MSLCVSPLGQLNREEVVSMSETHYALTAMKQNIVLLSIIVLFDKRFSNWGMWTKVHFSSYWTLTSLSVY